MIVNDQKKGSKTEWWTHIYLSIHHIKIRPSICIFVVLSQLFSFTSSLFLHNYAIRYNLSAKQPLLFLLSIPSFLRFSLRYTIHARAPPKFTTFFHTLKLILNNIIIIKPTLRIWSYFDATPNHSYLPFFLSFSSYKLTNEFQTCHAAFT